MLIKPIEIPFFKGSMPPNWKVNKYRRNRENQILGTKKKNLK